MQALFNRFRELTPKTKSPGPTQAPTRSLPLHLPTNYPHYENAPRPHLYSNSASAPSALRRQSHRTNPSIPSRTLSFLLPTTTPYQYLTPGDPSLTSPRKILLTQPSSPAQHPLAPIRTLPGEARSRLATLRYLTYKADQGGNVSDSSVRSNQMAYCDRCARSFPHNEAYEQHRSNSHAHWLCDSCDIDFASEESLVQHYWNNPKHHYCKECERHFDSAKSKMQHMETEHWYCETHNRVFDSEHSLESHYRASGDHIYCAECKINFDDDDKWWGHLEEEHHACAPCRKQFCARKDLEQHNQQVHHACTECQRSFRNAHDAQQHANSGVHQEAQTLRCPGAGCGRTFVSNSALAGHLESGTCASRMTRDQLDRLVVRADRKNYVTQRWATQHMWDGAVYKCPMCGDGFDKPEQLSEHLQSPRHAHADNMYKCPDCAREFPTLSSLCGHFENGSCGAGSFRRVRKAMNSWTRLQV